MDVPAARRRCVMVANTPGVVTEDTADLAMALIPPRRGASPKVSR